jgi:hypothetical protein
MQQLAPQPLTNLRFVDPDDTPAQYWQQYFLSLDRIVRTLASGQFGPLFLVSAVNDADAARQGIGVGFVYESGGALKVRKV